MEPPPPGPSMDFSSAVLDDPSSALWDWGDLLDFTVDDHIPIAFDADTLPPPPPPPPEDEIPQENSPQDRVRKRDPRLTCSNFLAGVIPCACPELDEMLKEEEEAHKENGGPAKKRSRTVRASGGKARCQVPGCEADISELKGYHRRHRVCLRCANATVVVIDGESKRYCQQCGKFHVLPDFDEGKRSCRRKLERHNNRRRRKSVDSKGAGESSQTELVVCDDGDGEESLKGSSLLSSQIAEKEALVESESGQISNLCSAPDSKNSDSVASFGASGETRIDGPKDNFNNSVSASNWDSKNAYSSPCPTGRISFKLYDWNPAEFPRRLRQQIFHWLGNMPVELEGYIRPGCIILTVFVAMPKLMWAKLYEDPVSYVQDFVVAPGSLLSGKGNMFVHLNNMAFQVMKNGTSMMEVKPQAPRLHYVQPICFEAGKAMEFVACGNNLLQPKARFLVSFAEKYMEYDYCVATSCGETEGGTGSISSHQLYKINIPHTPSLFGPAFIEVESESGLSNFIPVLIADKEICSEMKIVQQRLDISMISQGSQFVSIDSLSISCEVSAMRQTTLSEFILDLAWLLKEPKLEKFQQTTTSSQIQRFSYMLRFLIQNELINTLEKILQNLKVFMDDTELNSASSASSLTDMRLLLMYIDCAKDIIHKKNKESSNLNLHPGSPKLGKDFISQSFPQHGMPSAASVFNQDMHMQSSEKLERVVGLASTDRSETVPLLNREVVMNMNHIKEWPRKPCVGVVSGSLFGSRPTIFVIATIAVCVGLCAVVLHPNKVSEFAVSIRRCLFDKL